MNPRAKTYVLDDGIMEEVGPDLRQITLWLPGAQGRGFREWERISELPHSRFTVEPGYAASAVTLIRARQRAQGIPSRIFGRFRRAVGPTWALPNGEVVEQTGDRQSDLLLVWSENSADSIDEAWVRSRWPQRSTRRLGPNVYLVAGVETPVVGPEVEAARECPHAAAQALLTAARASGDAHRETTALADLGAAYLHGGYAEHAAKTLGDALRLSVQVCDYSLQSDILCNLGWLTLSAGNPARALEIFEQALSRARQASNPYVESTALERRGMAYVRLNAPPQALEAFTQALAVARAAGFRKPQADLHWYIAIECGELGQREQALAHGQAAVNLMKETGNPRAAWFADHLERYRAGQTVTMSGDADEGVTLPGASVEELPVSGIWASPAATSGPGFLRMAVSAAKAMARFVGSGFKTAPAQIVQHRLRTCAACAHHTGLRCRLCGCFTSAKARLAHEECPIGKWPASANGVRHSATPPPASNK